jgi:DNA polymerase sigma
VRDEIAGRLRILLRHMRASRLVRKAIVIGRAKVPIIKATLEPAGLQMDISMGTLNGHQAVDFINRQVR